MTAGQHAADIGWTCVGEISLGDPVVLPDTASVAEVAASMTRHGTSAVLLVDPGGVEAIVTEHDLTRALAMEVGPGARAAVVATAYPVTVPTGARVLDAVLLMLERGVRHLPVMNPAGAVVGVLSLDRAIAAVAAAPDVPGWVSALRVALRMESGGERRR